MYILDDHNEERQLDTQSFLWVLRTGDECVCDIGAHDFENGRLNILIGEPLDMSIVN